MSKIQCYGRKYICKNMAVWIYVPADSLKQAYCNSCVPRGCSCNFDENGVEIFGEDGKSQPCCEYLYDKNGFEEN